MGAKLRRVVTDRRDERLHPVADGCRSQSAPPTLLRAHAKERRARRVRRRHRVDLEKVAHLCDRVNVLAAGADDERHRLAAEVVHVLARPHHHHEALRRDTRNVGAREVARRVERAVGGELRTAQKALKRQRQRSADVGVLGVGRVEAHVHRPPQRLRRDAAPHRAPLLADRTPQALEHRRQPTELHARAQLHAVLLRVPTLNLAKVAGRRVWQHAVLRCERRVGVHRPAGDRALGRRELAPLAHAGGVGAHAAVRRRGQQPAPDHAVEPVPPALRACGPRAGARARLPRP
eukprot:7389311-Prymnesium_polylepis.3